MSQSSLVSFARREIHETLPGMALADYIIEPCEGDKKPRILIIDDNYYYKPDIEGRQDRVFVPSAQIADSIVHMHITSQLGYTAIRHPALFSLPDVIVDEKTVFEKYAQRVTESIKRQRKWFEYLVQMADDDWQQAKRHNMISDIQRTAARELGLTREWLIVVPGLYDEPKANCPFCASDLINKDAPVCPHCMRVINAAKLAEIEARLGVKKVG